MLYNNEDYLEVKLARRKILLQLLAATIIFIAVIVVCSIIRVSWPGYAIAVIWGIFVIFIWGMRGTRIRKYYHFLRDISRGLENNIKGAVEDIDLSVSVKDMLDYYTIILREDGSASDSPARKLYYDISKGIPQYPKGTRLAVSLFGNYIKGIEII